MIKLQSDHIARITNMLLRLATLAAKLGMTLYMGRFLTFADIGTYGLVFGAVMVMTAVLGVKLDYLVSREIVGTTPHVVLAKMRDQAVFYGINYVIMAVVMLALAVTDATGVTGTVMLLIFVISVVESTANMTYANINSLGRPLLANFLFFIRSGLWCLVIAAIGIVFPAFRTSDAILVAWIIGSAISLIVTLWTWRDLPWREMARTPVDWAWIKHGVSACFFIWLGTIGATFGFYVDRFIVAQNLGLDMAGVATFYSSFTTAMVTLVQSGVLAFAYPRLITFHRENNQQEFWGEVKKSAWHVALFGGISAVGVGIAVPVIGHFFHRPILVDEVPTLWLMLLGAWLRSNAFTLYYILFARHQDRAIWLGDLLCLIPAFGVNAVLVPYLGFIGIGYGSVMTTIFLILWRFYYVKAGSKKPAVA